MHDNARRFGRGRMQIPGECYVKCIDVLSTCVPRGLLAAVSEKDADVLVMGISGYG